MAKPKPRPTTQRDWQESHLYPWEHLKSRGPIVMETRDDKYGYTVRYVNGIALTFTRDHG